MWNFNKERLKIYVYATIREIFIISLFFFIIFIILEYWQEGLVTNYFDLNFLLWFIIIMEIILLLYKEKNLMIDIEGVKIKKLKVYQDKVEKKEVIKKPGFLMEVLRDDDGLLKKFGQTTFTVAYQGTIKAFHWHKKQDDLWFVATGKAVVVLYDLRENSPTKGETEVIMAGENDYKLILIPAGVAHGYKVLSKEPVLLFYHTTESYNLENPDEERIPYDDPAIGFDWNELK